jgi:hypothetical protein
MSFQFFTAVFLNIPFFLDVVNDVQKEARDFCCIELLECLVHQFHCNVHGRKLFYSCVLQSLRHAGQTTISKIFVRPSC